MLTLLKDPFLLIYLSNISKEHILRSGRDWRMTDRPCSKTLTCQTITVVLAVIQESNKQDYLVLNLEWTWLLTSNQVVEYLSKMLSQL